MKRYEFDEHGDPIAYPGGEWVRYADHVEAMKRVAGAGAQQAEPVAFQKLCDALPEGVHWGDPLTPKIAAALAQQPQGEDLEWQIEVAGPAGYVRFETFSGETLEAALDSVRKQNFCPAPDEDGFVTMKVKV